MSNWTLPLRQQLSLSNLHIISSLWEQQFSPVVVAAGVVFTDVFDWAEGLCYLLSDELAGV